MGVRYEDAMEIYERARREVTIPRSDGRRQAYAAVRYKQQIEGVKDNKSMLVTVIANIIKKRTSGFDHLAETNRPDLMVENLVLDKTMPYHRFFTQNTRNVTHGGRFRNSHDLDAEHEQRLRLLLSGEAGRDRRKGVQPWPP